MNELFSTREDLINAISNAISRVLKGIGLVFLQFQVMCRVLTFLFPAESKADPIHQVVIVIFASANLTFLGMVLLLNFNRKKLH